MEPVSILFARFPFGGSESPRVTDWLISTAVKCERDDRIGEVYKTWKDDTPITMSRNFVVEQAKEMGVDLLVMIDNDMAPDLPEFPFKPFWDTSFEFWLEHRNKHPMVVGAPYCGPPPHCNVYVFRWRNFANPEDVGPDTQHHLKLDQFTREEAADRIGIERVAAIGTGIVLVDMRVFDRIDTPYFDYEWSDKREMAKDSTEDVYWTRNCDLIGNCPTYCNWDAWAGHIKSVVIGKPKKIYSESVSRLFMDAAKRNQSVDERVMIVGDPTRQSAAGDIHASSLPSLEAWHEDKLQEIQNRHYGTGDQQEGERTHEQVA